MYVCICNGIKDREVRSAINEGAKSVGKVFESHGCKANCGKCINRMRDVIHEEVNGGNLLKAAE